MTDQVRTDDMAMALRYLYRGTPTMPLPPAKPSTYGVAIALTMTGWLLTWLVVPTGLLRLAAVLVTVPAAVFVARRLMRSVDYYRTIRHYRSVVAVELNTPRRPPAAQPVTTDLTLDLFT